MTGAADQLAAQFLAAATETFHAQKSLAERAIAQVSDAQLHQRIADPAHADSNPIAVIVRHMAGNMHSRWTDFLSTDGEKATRDRDAEFTDDGADRATVMQRWECGWSVIFDTLDALTPADLTRTVTIRGQPHTVSRAILRQIDHYGAHTAQIVMTAKLLAGPNWQTLTVPRGGTAAFNASLGYTPGDR